MEGRGRGPRSGRSSGVVGRQGASPGCSDQYLRQRLGTAYGKEGLPLLGQRPLRVWGCPRDWAFAGEEGIAMGPMVHVAPDAMARVCREYHVKELSVFGSVAKGIARDDSDVDVLVEPDYARHPTLFDMARLQAALEALFGRPVDLVTKKGLSPLLAQDVLAHREILYAE